MKTTSALLAFLLLSLLISLSVMTYFIIKYEKSPTFAACREARGKTLSCSGNSDMENCPYFDTEPKNEKFIQSYRLPTNIIPVTYNVTLDAYFHGYHKESNFTYNGTVSILIHVKNDTPVISLHAGNSLNYTIGDIIVKEVNSDENLVESLDYDNDRELITIRTSKMLRANSSLVLKFEQFFSTFNEHLKGFYYTNYTHDGVVKHMATSQLQPTDARTVFPCFDEPSFKATFRIKIIREKKYHSLCNARKIKTITLPNGREEDEYEETPIMATYILAFIVSELPHKSIKFLGDKELRLYVQPKFLDQVDFSLNAAKRFLEIFEPYFGQKYPLKKLDMVAVPEFNAGAMENWGLIIFRESSMLFDPKKCSATTLQKMTKIVFHELGHMWFGNLVTMKWWTHLWLNEGFASFIETLGIRHVFPDWYDSNSLHFEIQSLYNTETKRKSQPILVHVDQPKDINRLFNDISYVKGNAIIYMCEGFLGEKKLQEFFRRYLAKFALKNTESQDLWNTLSEVIKESNLDIDIHSAMEGWLNKSGIPLITVSYLGNNTFNFEQNRLNHYVKKNSKEDDVVWTIPLNYVTNRNNKLLPHEDIKWIKKKNFNLTIPFESEDDWIILNIQRRAYYITNYDDVLWDRISNILQRDHTLVPVENRAMILDDAFRLAQHNFTDISAFMKIAKYLKKEKHSFPWRIASKVFQIIHQVFMQSEYFELIQVFANDIVDPHLDDLLWDYEPEDKNTEKHKIDSHVGAIASLFDHPKFLKKAEESYKEWLSRNKTFSYVANSLKGPMLFSYFKRATRAEWNDLYKLFVEEDSDNMKSTLLNGLLATREYDLIKKFLDINSQKSNIIRQELASWPTKNPVVKYYYETLSLSVKPFVYMNSTTGLTEFSMESLKENLELSYVEMKSSFTLYKINELYDLHGELIPSLDTYRYINETLEDNAREEFFMREVMPKMLYCLGLPNDCGSYKKNVSKMIEEPDLLRMMVLNNYKNFI